MTCAHDHWDLLRVGTLPRARLSLTLGPRWGNKASLPRECSVGKGNGQDIVLHPRNEGDHSQEPWREAWHGCVGWEFS